jgi:hypothetical protein
MTAAGVQIMNRRTGMVVRMKRIPQIRKELSVAKMDKETMRAVGQISAAITEKQCPNIP